MALKTIKKLLLVAASLITGCQSPDYAVVTGGKGETVYVEVPGPTEYVEVPVYVEVEVPAEHGDIWVDSFVQSKSTDGIDIIQGVRSRGMTR